MSNLESRVMQMEKDLKAFRDILTDAMDPRRIVRLEFRVIVLGAQVAGGTCSLYALALVVRANGEIEQGFADPGGCFTVSAPHIAFPDGDGQWFLEVKSEDPVTVTFTGSFDGTAGPI